MPLVSCVIPTYNRAEFVKRAIDSVLNQTYENIEVIVVDDGSQDNTREVVLSIKDKRVRYIRLHRNFGVSFARNIGIENSTGDFIAFLDSDDYFLPEKIEKQVELMLKDKRVGVCYTEVYYEIEDGKLIYEESPRARGKIYEDILRVPKPIVLQTLVVRRDLIYNYNLRFDESMRAVGDVKFIVELSRIANFDFIQLPLCVVDRRKDTLSITRKQLDTGTFLKYRVEFFEELVPEFFRVCGSSYVSFFYNRYAWTAYYRCGCKSLSAKLLFKSSFKTKNLKDFLKAVFVILGLYEKYMIKKYGKEKLEKFAL